MQEHGRSGAEYMDCVEQVAGEEEEVAGRGLSSRAAAALAGRRWVRRARARGEARVQEEGHAGRGAWRLGVCAPMRAVSCQRWGERR